MQPHSPQLPRDDARRSVPKNLKKGAVWLRLLIAVVATLAAFMLPKKRVDAQRAGTSAEQQPPRQQRLVNEGYQHPTR